MSETGPGWFDLKRAKNNKSPSAKTNTRPRRTGIMVLEPRMMYDAAAAATVAATETHQDAAADHAVVAAAADKQTVAVTSNTGADTQSAAASTTPAQAPNVAAPAAPASASGTDADKATTSADTSAPAAAPAIVTVHELVVIDSRVDDIGTLLGGVKAGDAVLVLDPSKDGVQQIADAIAANNLHDLTAIQIISHGTPGAVDLGSISLSDDNLDSHAAALAAMGAALAPGGDIMLWGCDVAAGATGAKFITDLSAHTGGAHVAASTDATGSAALGGNWTLEAKTGDIDATLPFSDATRDAYTDLLAAPINNYQSSLALTQLVVPSGAYPARDNGGGGGFVIGTIRTFAGDFSIGNTYYAEGQLEAINQNVALFSLLGTFYGGDGKSTYALPDLGGKVMIGQGVGSDGQSHDVGEQEGSATVSLTTLNLPGTGSQPFDNDQPSLTITYCILTQGVFPTNNSGGFSTQVIGEVVAFAGNFAPGAYLPCDGRSLAISQYETLYAVIGNRYGGSVDEGTFKLPDLQGRAIMGASSDAALGTVVGLNSMTITTANLPSSMGGFQVPLDNREPSLELNYIVATQGIFPSADSGGLEGTMPYMGEIMAFAGDIAHIPQGWALADGRELAINVNQPLFSLLGFTYGGNGSTTFRLPNLINRVVIGVDHDANIQVGRNLGSDTITLTTSTTPDRAPALSVPASTTSVIEQQGPVFITTNAATVGDLDLDWQFGGAGNYDGTTLTVTRDSGANATDSFDISTIGATFTISGNQLQFQGQTFGSFTDSGGTLTIDFDSNGGPAPSRALVNDVLRHITYDNTSDSPPTRLVVALNDGNTGTQGADGAKTGSALVALPIVAVNDAPVAGASSVSLNEDTSFTFHASDFHFTDPADAPAGNSLLNVLLTSLPSAGTLTYNGVALTAANVAGNGFAVSVADLAAGKLTFTPTANGNGAGYANFSFKIQDNGGTANNGVDVSTAAATMSINVNAVNDAPSFTLSGTTTASNEDSGAQTVAGFATAVSAGPADESGQAVSFVIAGNSNAALFATGPAIDANGNLTYTAAANAFGTATITVHAHDNGGTGSGGVDNSADQTFTITVNPVNDAPSFTLTNATSSNEDAGAQSVANFATAILAGPANEGAQAVNFIVTGNTNPDLFAVGPAIDANGRLTYTAAANASGTATITVHAHDDGGIGNGGIDSSADKTFTITINPVNDAPSFSLASITAASNEDAGPQTVAGFATAISAGPADESGQAVSFVVSGNSNAALFAVGPAIDADGKLTYTATANAAGTATITLHARDSGGTGNGGIDSSTDQTFTITVNPINDAPSFTLASTTTTSNEDAGAQSVANFATAISAGPANEGAQAVNFVVTGNTYPDLFAVGPAIDANGRLTYTAAANASGTATITVHAHDDGGTGNGGIDSSADQTFTITVNPVNDAPGFTLAGSASSNEDAGAQTVVGFATAISAGPADENTQTVSFVVSGNTNPVLFAVGPSIDANGNLTYTAAANATGTATITVHAHDNGGTANGGIDTSADQTFTITVNPVNDAPSFTLTSTTSSNEDAGAQSVANFATAISPGPADEAAQAVNFVVAGNTNPDLFAVGPSIDANGTLIYTAAANASGTATITVHARDNGGTADGGVDTSADQTFTITVNSVNDAPGFTVAGSASSNEDAGAQSVANFATAISAGPADENAQAVSFVVSSNTNPALFAVGPSIDADGNLTYTAAANATGTATITVHAHDDGGTANGGIDNSTDKTFTITVNPVNDAPSFTLTSATSSNEDAGARSVANFATAISAGPADENAQTVSFVVAGNTNPGLFSVGPSIDANGSLTYTAAANASGTATITVHARDSGGTANGGVDTSADQTFTITVNPVNDAPGFTLASGTNSNEDAGAQTVANFATAISAGPADENAQAVSFVVTGNSNAALFAVGPSIDADGNLTYTAAANASGTATITVHAKDSGGTANGGVDSSADQTFTITVSPVNDAPSFTLASGTTSNEDAGAQTVANFATAISAGPTADETGSQAVNFVVTGNTNPGLFAVGPSIDANGNLTYTAAANASGTATIIVHAHDNGGTADGGIDSSADQTFTITVNPVNDAPVATVPAIAYTAIEQTPLDLKASGLAVGDIDGGTGIEIVTLSVGEGILNVTAGTSGATVSGSGSASVTITGTIDQINALLGSDGTSTISYFNELDAPSASTVLTLTIHDQGNTGGGDLSNAASVTIDITPVNDAPALTVGASAAYTENAVPTILDPGLVVSDVDGGSGYSATVTITAGFVAGDQLIGGGTWDAATHTFTTSGHLAPNASLAALQADLQTLGFFSTSDDPGAGPRTLTWTISDGSATFTTTTVVEVTPVNDPAVIGGVTTGTAVEAGGAGNSAVGTPTVSGVLTDADVDNPANTFEASSASAHGSFTMTAGGTWTYALDNGNAQVQALNAGQTLTDSFTVHTIDGTAQQVTITIAGANDTPVVTAGNTLDFNANVGQPVTLDAAIALHDVDSATMAGARVAIAGGFDAAGDILGFVNAHGISGSYDAATGVLTLAGNASIADYQAALASVTFISTTQQNGARSIQWTVDDGSAAFHQSLPGITTLNVQGIIVPPHLFTDNSVTTPSKGLLPAGNGASGSPASFVSGFGAGFFGNGGDGAAGGFSNGSSYHVVHTDAVLTTASDATVQINLALAALEAPLGGDVAFVVARQANGDPLPDWLKFDPATGTFAGLPPDNAVASIEPDQASDSNIVTGALPTNPDLGLTPPVTAAKPQTITVEVLARDSKGNVAVTTFTIDLRAHPAGKQGWNIQPFGPARHASLATLSPELAAIESAVRDATPSVEPFAARGMPVRHGEAISVGGREAVPAGRAGLTEQLASIGWRSMDAQRSALLASLQQGRR
jgi:VCBS repeat-containing protein